MTVIETITGMESLDIAELKCTTWYVPYSRCPIGFNPAEAGKMSRVSIGALVKANRVGPKGDKVERVSVEGPFFLNPKNRTEVLASKQTSWFKYKHDYPNGFIMKLAVFESLTQFGAMKHVANIFYRVRDTAPYIQVNYKNGHGLEFLVKGRLDRLSTEYVIKNSLIGHPSEMGSIQDAVIDMFLTTTILMPATKDISNLVQEHIVLDDEIVPIQRQQRAREVNSLL